MNLTEFLERPEILRKAMEYDRRLLFALCAERGAVSSPFEEVVVARSMAHTAPFEGIVESIVDLEAKVAEETAAYRAAFDEAKEFIRSVEPDQDRWLLFWRYLLGKTWEEVASAFGRSRSWAKNHVNEVIHNLEPKWAEKGQK